MFTVESAGASREAPALLITCGHAERVELIFKNPQRGAGCSLSLREREKRSPLSGASHSLGGSSASAAVFGALADRCSRGGGAPQRGKLLQHPVGRVR